MKKKKILGIVLTVVALVFTVAVCYFVGTPLVKYAREPEKFRNLVDSCGIWGYLLFIATVYFQVIFAFIPGEPFEMLAGYAFGAIPGAILCTVGASLGSATVFLLTRKWGIKFVELFFSAEKINSVKFLRNKKKTYILTFLAFFIPGTPKDLLSYVAGLTHINFWAYMLISTVARFPSVITSTVSGGAFGSENYIFGICAFAVTGIISAVGILVYNKMNKENSIEKHIGKTVNVMITREKSETSPLNYGCVNGIWSNEGDLQDAYICGVSVALKNFSGKTIGYIDRDGKETLIIVPKHSEITKEQILSELALCEKDGFKFYGKEDIT